MDELQHYDSINTKKYGLNAPKKPQNHKINSIVTIIVARTKQLKLDERLDS